VVSPFAIDLPCCRHHRHPCMLPLVSGPPAVLCARSGRSSGGPSPSSPRISAVHAQQRVSRPSPRRTSCRAVCAMNCVWRLSAVYSPQNWWRGVLLPTTSELIVSSIHEFDSRLAAHFAAHHQCVRHSARQQQPPSCTAANKPQQVAHAART
jgi:hypothetical protein